MYEINNKTFLWKKQRKFKIDSSENVENLSHLVKNEDETFFTCFNKEKNAIILTSLRIYEQLKTGSVFKNLRLIQVIVSQLELWLCNLLLIAVRIFKLILIIWKSYATSINRGIVQHFFSGSGWWMWDIYLYGIQSLYNEREMEMPSNWILPLRHRQRQKQYF